MHRFSLSTILVFSFLGLQAQDVFESARKGDLSNIKRLYEADTSCINQKNGQDYSPLILACYYNQLEIVKFLIEKNVELNSENKTATALQACSYKGFFEIAQELLEYGAEPNIVDANGTSPLIYATQFQHFNIIKLLLKYGADKDYADPNGNTALDYAQKLNISEAIQILKA